jgi:hypothetical protein
MNITIHSGPAPNHMTILQRRNVYKVFMGKPGGKRKLGKPKHRSEHNIKMDLTEIR